MTTPTSHPPTCTLPRPTLGVVAISYNEERDLQSFLEHLLPWVDEIVIVDDGSTDATAAMAQAAGPKVTFIRSPRQSGEYYSEQRNKGIQAAKSDWLLHMDIDERVPPELAREILSSISQTAFDAYRYRRLNFFLHRPMRGGGWQTWNRVQLARRNKSQFQGKIHETCVVDTAPNRVGQLQNPMWHLNDTDFVERVRKNMAYMQIEAEKLRERGVRVRWYHFLWHPFLRTMRAYFLQGGYRDGVLGVLYAMYVLTGTFNWYATAWDRNNSIARNDLEAQLRELWARQRLNA